MKAYLKKTEHEPNQRNRNSNKIDESMINPHWCFFIGSSGTLRHGYNVKTRQTNYFFIPGRCRRSNLTKFGEVITM